MPRNEKKFTPGKLNHEFLEKLLLKHASTSKNSRVIMGSKIGEDAAVIDMGDKYLVSKTDPITFATERIGYYSVNINVNDIVCTGARPLWFQSTILLPEKTASEELIESIFKDISDTCYQMGISVVGGHTEITAGLDRPIIVGSLLGEVEKESLVLSSGAKPGDALVLTKGVFIEGTSIIAREKGAYLKKIGCTEEFVEKCKEYLFNPGISVAKEALLVSTNYSISAMHDPTEGGLMCGIAEMALASNTGVEIEAAKINVLPEPLELSKIFEIDPKNTISSGSLLIAIKEEDSEEMIKFLLKNKINAEKIGVFSNKKNGLKIKDEQGKIVPLEYSEKDEISKVFNFS
ncbi:MAG: AIR synthase family protein [Candidatus Lokiarchaeota archaeon]|nr:AIR synthase family protein [Candidatus Lokiarchaeota archaeon]